MYKSKLVNTCQICKSKNLKSILFLGYLPPVNKFIKSIQNQNRKKVIQNCYFVIYAN